MQRFSANSHYASLATRAFGAGAVMVSGAALLGWLTGWTLMASIRAGYIPMAPNTALSLLALGLALIFISFPVRRARYRLLPALAGVFIMAVTFATLLVNIADIIPSFDQLLFHTEETVRNFPAGQMSPITAVLLFLCGAALVILQLSDSRFPARTLASVLAGVVLAVGMVILLGYSYGTPLLYGGTIIPIAATTAIGLMFIAMGLITAAGVETWPLRVLAGPSTHSRLLRIFLPQVAFIIFLEGLVIVSIQQRFGINPAIVTSVTAIVLFIPVIMMLYRVSVWLGGSLERATAERDQAQELIAESETKLRAIFENSRDAIGVVREGAHVMANPAYLELFGFERGDELIGKPLLDLIAPASRDRVAVFLRDRQAGLKTPAFLEARGLTRDGREFDLEASASTYATKGATFTLGIVRDISERKALEQQLIQSQKMESIGRLAGGVAHDFNNYLTAVLGYTDLSMADLGEESPVYGNLLEVRSSCERLADLTNQLLLFSRQESGRLSPADLNMVISDLLRMLGRLVGEQYSLVTELGRGLWPIDADVGHLGQVIMNLVVNARDAMPEGGRITIRTENVTGPEERPAGGEGGGREDYVCLSVADEGVGMEPEMRERIFEPFFSTKKDGKGTGLGLAVVFGIVKQHHGWIDLDSQPGSGTVFRVYFPRGEAAAEPSAARPAAAPESKGGLGERILLVEDEEPVRRLALKALTQEGYRVTAAADAETALGIFLEDADGFDLVFSDVVLPGKDGVWLMESVLELKPGTPVVLASGYNNARLRPEDHRYAFMPKPYKVSELLGLLQKTLGNHPGTFVS